jgi:hypothetical protein
VLRDRPHDVKHIVSIWRGKLFLALVGADGKLLAKPLVLKNALAISSRANRRAVQQDAQTSAHAVAIANRLCPEALTAEISDTLGLTSLARLARKAIGRVSG